MASYRLVATACAVTAALSLLAACGSEASSSPDEPTTVDASVAAPVESDCAELAADRAQSHGERSFVEASGVDYVVSEAGAIGTDRAVVTVTVEPADEVGYGSVKFLSECSAGGVDLLAGYVPEGDTFALLFTTTVGDASGHVPAIAP